MKEHTMAAGCQRGTDFIDVLKVIGFNLKGQNEGRENNATEITWCNSQFSYRLRLSLKMSSDACQTLN